MQAVAAKAGRIAPLAEADVEVAVAAAWLHDIGYAPDIVNTGMHALDGARWLLREGFSSRVAGLVAHHSCASYEADERGLAEVLSSEFMREESPTSDVLWFADMTTGPDGQDLTVKERLAEIRERYGPEDLVSRFWARAEPALTDAVRRARGRMRTQPM
ncbi:HD domain-containing protein [Micromonospora chokoriensis]|uniref:HD domain-containing protein n=1 Tax=Micromonospora chokoriensis TaxID=356851 RepID=UPI002FBEE098